MLIQQNLENNENEKQRQKQVLKLIQSFNSLKCQVLKYIWYKNEGLINSDIEGLKITETTDGVCVENILNGKNICAITFSKTDREENLKIFAVQTLTNKDELTNPEIVGLYSKKFENLESVPNLPNEKQMSAILSIEKKTDVILAPLNIEASKQYKKIFDKTIKNEKK